KKFSWKKSAEIAAERIRELAAEPEKSSAATKVSKVSKLTKSAPIALPKCAKLGHLSEARELLKVKQHRDAWESAIEAIRLRPFHPEAFLLLAEIAAAANDSVSARRCAQH